MKNKLIKTMMGVGLACVSGMTLAGCSLTADQQGAINKLLEKTDRLVNVVEKSNTKLSKDEIAEKIFIARRMFDFADFKQLKISTNESSFSGVFDNKISSGSLEFYYKSTENIKQSVAYEEELGGFYKKSNFENNKHYECFVKNGVETGFSEKPDGQVARGDYWNFSFLDVFDEYFDVITAEDIKDVKVLENGYHCFLYSEGIDLGDSTAAKKVFMEVVLNNDKISLVEIKVISIALPEGCVDEFNEEYSRDFKSLDELLEYSVGEIYVSKTYSLNIQYEGIDFTNFDNEFALIDANHQGF